MWVILGRRSFQKCFPSSLVPLCHVGKRLDAGFREFLILIFGIILGKCCSSLFFSRKSRWNPTYLISFTFSQKHCIEVHSVQIRSPDSTFRVSYADLEKCVISFIFTVQSDAAALDEDFGTTQSSTHILVLMVEPKRLDSTHGSPVWPLSCDLTRPVPPIFNFVL